MANSMGKFELLRNGFWKATGWGLGLILSALIFMVICMVLHRPLDGLCDKLVAVAPGSPHTKKAPQSPKGASTSTHEASPSSTPPKGPAISARELTGDIISYYNTFITILVALLGATAIIGYLHMRHMSREEAQKRAHQAVGEYFDLEKTHRLLDDRIASAVGEWITDEDTIPGKLEWLEEQIEQLRQFSNVRMDIDELRGEN